jgi:predicted small lipoprotein YifL
MGQRQSKAILLNDGGTRMPKILIAILLLCVLGVSCGVKGPPEPPITNEAQLQKEQIIKEQKKDNDSKKEKK